MSTADIVVISLRALSFIGTFQAAGLILFLLLFKQLLTHSTGRIQRAAVLSTVSAVALILTHHLLGPARMTGTFVGIFDPSLQIMLFESSAGSARILRIFGLTLLGASLYTPRQLRAPLGLFGIASAIGSFGLMGHTSVHELRWILAPLLFIHLSIVAFWFGSLLSLGIVTRLENAAVRNQILARFSKVAVGTVPVIAFAGVIILYLLLPDLTALQTPYGLAAIAKTVGFILLIGLAGLNRFRYLPGLRAGDPSSLLWIRRSIAIEWAVMCLVFTCTAVMTALFSPGY